MCISCVGELEWWAVEIGYELCLNEWITFLRKDDSYSWFTRRDDSGVACSSEKIITRPSPMKIDVKPPTFLQVIRGDICGLVDPPYEMVTCKLTINSYICICWTYCCCCCWSCVDEDLMCSKSDSFLNKKNWNKEKFFQGQCWHTKGDQSTSKLNSEIWMPQAKRKRHNQIESRDPRKDNQIKCRTQRKGTRKSKAKERHKQMQQQSIIRQFPF